MQGSANAAGITAAVYLVAALILGLIVRQRLAGPVEVKPATSASAAGGQTDLASMVALLVREELPKNAVPATLVALLGGVAAGVNPTAARNLTRARTSVA